MTEAIDQRPAATVPDGGARTFIVAEVGSVHDGSFGNATQLIDLAAELGADAVKFQAHIAEAETLPSAPPPPHFAAEPRFDYFKRTSFGLDQWRALHEHAARSGIEFLCSPFSIEAVLMLEDVGVRRYKVPSGEVTNLPLLERIGATRKPILLSSGMSTWDELDAAVATIRRYHDRLTVLQCTSEYPCPPERVGLNVMFEMRARYGTPVGLSDHTLATSVPIAAVALGARVIEKHLTFSRRMYGSDAKYSLEPSEFALMVEGIRTVERAIASQVDKADVSRLGQMKATFEKSIVATVDIPLGATIRAGSVAIRKPGTGLAPARLQDVVGRKTARNVSAGTVLTSDDVDWRQSAGVTQER